VDAVTGGVPQSSCFASLLSGCESMAYPLILYDGVCGLCNRFVQFVLRHDRKAIFRFASLQGPLAARILSRASPAELDTVYVVPNFDPENSAVEAQLNGARLSRSNAVLFVLRELGGFCRALAFAFRLCPRFLRDWGYRIIARHRYRTFGRYPACPLPEERVRNRFVDLSPRL